MSAVPSPIHRFDAHAAEAFSQRIAGMLDAGAASVMMALGHRLRLFDTLAALPSSDSHRVAQAAGLTERYVREWLAAMTTAGIVVHDPVTGTYTLPQEHAASLTHAAELGNFAMYGQHVAMMGTMLDRVERCFRDGGGTRYDEYPHFHEIMAEDSGQTVVAALFDHLLPLVPDVMARLEAGIDVLDAGCGRGAALHALAARYPASRFVGYDLCADAIAFAREAADSAGLSNLRFEARDLGGFDDRAAFDFVLSFDAVHDQKDPQALLLALRGALRAGGTYLMQDIGGSATLANNLDFPLATLLYGISCVHCTPISLGQGGEGLGTMWGWETALRMLDRAGFSRVERHVLPHDPMNVWFIARP
jgi:SAM-dependent methyltransferase